MCPDDQKKDLTSLLELSAAIEDINPDETGAPATGDPNLDLDPQPEIAIHLNENMGEPDLGPISEAVSPLDSELAPQQPVLPPLGLAAAAPEMSIEPFDGPPIEAPPADWRSPTPAQQPPPQKQDLESIKQFGERLSIGKPRLEAVPAFSVLLSMRSGHFSETCLKTIEELLETEDFGIRFQDVKVQTDQGKLLIPRISEFAAIVIAQKIRDSVDDIDIDVADEIYKGRSADVTTELNLVDAQTLDQHREEIHDLDSEPASENEVFTTNLSDLDEVKEYRIMRILSAITTSAIIDAMVAENPAGRAFEAATEKLTQELITRAFRLRANGVIGVTFTLRPINGYRDPAGQVVRAYRMLGSGTAVRARRIAK